MAKNKRWVFWFHYNKPASKKTGRPQLSVHWRGRCHIVSKVICKPSTETVTRTRQPHCVVKGMAGDIVVTAASDGVGTTAWITNQ